jgi:hypothetical protein
MMRRSRVPLAIVFEVWIPWQIVVVYNLVSTSRWDSFIRTNDEHMFNNGFKKCTQSSSRRQSLALLHIYSSFLTATIESNRHSLPRWQPLGKQNVKLSRGATKCHVKLSCTFGVCGILPCAQPRHQTYSHGTKQAISVGGVVHFQWHAGSIYLWADSQQFDWVVTRAQIQKSYARQSQRACQTSDSQGSTVLQKKNRALRVTPL